MSPCCLEGWILVIADLDASAELAGEAPSHKAPPPRLFVGASIVETRWFGEACMELNGVLVAGSMCKARWHGRRNLCCVVLDGLRTNG
jgi:hypothetical protein